MERLISLYEYAESHNIDVDWCTMFRAESLSVKLNDGSCAIAIDPFKLVNTADETYKLAHELGHCETAASIHSMLRSMNGGEMKLGLLGGQSKSCSRFRK